ncbi:MAG: indolepyruvate ferredoxin oxidoreductase family protein, partial [Candidatus Competibacteraceae bacterium]|nr:indolepyruvate ferredoxin oxidoreductase family protein [Candidatus Competibacteraceae bacterium]
MTLKAVTINDKYTLREGRAFMTGIQALVRLPMMQRRRDQVAGLNTAGYISGYRGSPLGGLDQQMLQAQTHLQEHQIVFQPGVNEDLAATAVWGTQQAGLSGENRYDGVFAMWYGKGPGVDRSGDALRHGNLAGSAQNGGVLVLLGDDHTGESSTTVHQSEYAMMDAMIPVLNPAGVQEFLDYGLYGWAMSRYSGCWVALKCIHDTVESAASVDVSDERVQLRLPDDYPLPPDGLNIRWPDTWHAQERRLHDHKLAAVQAFCRANQLDQVKLDNPDARLGIVTTGKSYLDVLQALDDLGIDEQVAHHLGLRLYKVALSFPLEPQGALAFCQGLDMVIVVEEKRGLIETQLKDLLYGQPDAPATIVGKRNEQGEVLLQSPDRLDSNQIALAIGSRLLRLKYDQTLAVKVNQLRGLNEAETQPPAMLRTPYFCPGCPHNTSTRVPEGSHALAGIGCHFMAQWMDRDTARYTQMGGEGASWIGEAPFSKREHMFQNIGDGTYFHSGLLALRATVSAKVNVTYKILYNDAVAMTGGQSVDGPLTVPRITQQGYAEGVRRIAVVSDEPDKYTADAKFEP